MLDRVFQVDYTKSFEYTSLIIKRAALIGRRYIRMQLNRLLEAKKTFIVKKWFEQVMSGYDPDTAVFFKMQKDAFANPVGTTTSTVLEELFDAILEKKDADTISTIVDPLIRIRAVQSFTPSQAIGFILILKQTVRDVLKNEITDISLNDIFSFENEIDKAALIGFNIFMVCREKIYSLRTNEERNKIYKAFARAGLITEVEADEPNLKFV
jgi:hypothetical protein